MINIDSNLVFDGPYFYSLIIAARHKDIWIEIISIYIVDNITMAMSIRVKTTTWNLVKKLTSFSLPNLDLGVFSRGFRSNNYKILLDSRKSRGHYEVILLVTIISLNALRLRNFSKIPKLETRFLDIQKEVPSASGNAHLHDRVIKLVDVVHDSLGFILIFTFGVALG